MCTMVHFLLQLGFRYYKAVVLLKIMLTKILPLFLFCKTTIYAQSIVGDDWRIDPEAYEEIVVDSIDSEVKKYELPNIEPAFGSSFESPKKLQFPKRKNYKELLKDLRKNRVKALAMNDSLSWEERVLREQEGWINKKKEEQERWIKDKKKILEIWRNSKKDFKEKLPKIKRGLVPANVIKDITEVPEVLPGANARVIKEKVSILSQTFHLPLKHQGERSTCAAFASVRGIEMKLTPEKENYSEHFFFYLSRKDCRDKKCSQKGSWARQGLEDLSNGKFSLPTEKACPYNYTVLSDNITHIPLEKSCFRGKVKVNGFLKLQSLQEIESEIEGNNPVVIGFYVNDNFLTNDGFISNSNDKGKLKKDYAHTVLGIGVLPLSKKIHSSEGKFCLLVVNSWGSGWGIGGYSCLTENWMRKHIIENPSLSVQKVSKI